MTPDDLLQIILFMVLVVIVVLAVLAGLGARIAAKRAAERTRARLVEPDHGDQGGWPIDAAGYPTMLPKSLPEYGPYEAALNRFFARKRP